MFRRVTLVNFHDGTAELGNLLGNTTDSVIIIIIRVVRLMAEYL
jgi:hypothetical protein